MVECPSLSCCFPIFCPCYRKECQSWGFILILNDNGLQFNAVKNNELVPRLLRFDISAFHPKFLMFY